MKQAKQPVSYGNDDDAEDDDDYNDDVHDASLAFEGGEDNYDDDDDGEAHVAVAGWAPRPRSRPRRVPVERVSAPAHDSLKLCMMPQ
jgi:hypothetical protein